MLRSGSGRGIGSGWRRLFPIAIANRSMSGERGSSWPRPKAAARRKCGSCGAGARRGPPSRCKPPVRLSPPHQPVHRKKGQVSGYGRVSCICILSAFDGTERWVSFWFSFGARLSHERFFGYHSRFGALNSRLGANKFPFSRLREFPGKGLICLALFGAKTAFLEND
jgi:hypothetical protein